MRVISLAGALLIALGMAVGLTPQASNAQTIDAEAKETLPWSLDTGRHSNTGTVEVLAYTAMLASPMGGTAWMRLQFDDVNLGQSSRIQLTSLQNGDGQTLDAGTMQLWSNTSAMFVGDKVELKLYVAPGDADVGVHVTALTLGGARALRPFDAANSPNAPYVPDAQCGGTDDRVAYTDKRIGRLNGNCTAWIVSNGALLTAGHCVDFDPDDSGPMLPDGTLDITNATIVEFDVPPSTATGAISPSLVVNQYPVDTTYLTTFRSWRYDGNGQGLGKDWAVFGLQRNTTTGASATATRGFFRLLNTTPPNGTTLRVSGYGVDDGTANQTLQTHTGPQTLRVAAGPGNADIRFDYQVDTTRANSGSPILREGAGYAIGIHTNGGCGADAMGGVTGANSGTSFEVTALQTAIQQFPVAGTRHVDGGRVSTATETGHVFTPFDRISEGIADAPSGARVSIVAGLYIEPMTINKNVVLVAPVGLVVISK
jgi:V8-like Glu-specific endopeptidase